MTVWHSFHRVTTSSLLLLCWYWRVNSWFWHFERVSFPANYAIHLSYLHFKIRIFIHHQWVIESLIHLLFHLPSVSYQPLFQYPNRFCNNSCINSPPFLYTTLHRTQSSKLAESLCFLHSSRSNYRSHSFTYTFSLHSDAITIAVWPLFTIIPHTWLALVSIVMTSMAPRKKPTQSTLNSSTIPNFRCCFKSYHPLQYCIVCHILFSCEYLLKLMMESLTRACSEYCQYSTL